MAKKIGQTPCLTKHSLFYPRNNSAQNYIFLFGRC